MVWGKTTQQQQEDDRQQQSSTQFNNNNNNNNDNLFSPFNSTSQQQQKLCPSRSSSGSSSSGKKKKGSGGRIIQRRQECQSSHHRSPRPTAAANSLSSSGTTSNDNKKQPQLSNSSGDFFLGTKLNFSSPEPPPPDSSNDTLLDSSSAFHHPHTPREGGGMGMGGEEQFHQLEVSPIIRQGDNADDNNNDADKMQQPLLFRHAASPILPMNKRSNNDGDGGSSSLAVAAAAGYAALAAVDTSLTSTSILSTGNNDSTASTANINNTTLTLNNSNISRPTARKIRHNNRPKPDSSMFDVDDTPTNNNSSRQSIGSIYSHQTGSSMGAAVGSTAMTTSIDNTSSSRLLCPPTPIRTPAWAHNSIIDRGHNHQQQQQQQQQHQQPLGLKRANSLITTKVLIAAEAPSSILDNLSSLEDSMLEHDINESSMDTTTGETFPSAVESLEDHHHQAGEYEEGHDADDITLNHNDDRSTTTATTRMMMPITQSSSNNEETATNFSNFENLGILGSGAFADVYKVRSRKDNKLLYALKRTRRQFRGIKDRERAMAEVHTMKRLQSALLLEAAAASSSAVAALDQRGHDSNEHHHHHQQHHASKSNYGLYLLFFIQAWQQDGFFYCQTELCSRATCRHLRISLTIEWERDCVRYPALQLCLLESIRTDSSTADVEDGVDDGLEQQQQVEEEEEDERRLIPERAIWQICHDVSRGLYHIHSHGMVHYDIKPSNIFFVYSKKFGTICKIGDFGLAGDIGVDDDGQEGDTAYMANELLSSCPKHAAADIFSMGLTLYELASSPTWALPREGERWHDIRSGIHRPALHPNRSDALVNLIQEMIRPRSMDRPTAEDISELEEVKRAPALSDSFLSRYINDVEMYDTRRQREMESAEEEARLR